MASPAVLLVTTAADVASDYVAARLTERGASSFRLDTETFPLQLQCGVRFTPGQAVGWSCRAPGGDTIRLTDIPSIWFRRHRLPVFPTTVSPGHAEYCLREANWFIRGAIFALADGSSRCMSRPEAIYRAESKLHQLAVAPGVGLAIPDTLVSNDPDDVRAFADQYDGFIVAKALRLGYFDYGSIQTSVFTSRVPGSALRDATAISLAPVIYQPLLHKHVDLRVTVVGDDLWAAEILSQDEPTAAVDWRQSAVQLRHRPHKLPAQIAEGCLALLKHLQLAYGALDFVLTPDGEYVFLEVNPNGQWVWLEDELKFPISHAIASWLSQGLR
jgi:glutathione synthase/RimK-type ligase-like ATP-grasp enzyme